MEALVAYGNKKVKLVKIKNPDINNEEQVLLKVKGSGICGSDHIFFDSKTTLEWVRYPVIIGHEFAGTIEKVGKNVRDLQIGDHVVVDNYLRCGKCWYCKIGKYFLCDYHAELGQTIDGGFAEYCVVPQTNIVKIPKEIDFKYAAIIENIATALRTCRRVGIKFGNSIVVIGAGPLGTLIAKISNAMGAKVTVVSRGEARLNRIEKMGFHRVINSSKQDWKSLILENTSHKGVDIVFETSGSVETTLIASQIIRKAGKLVLLSITGGGKANIDLDRVVLGEIEIIGSVSGMGYFEEAIRMLEDRIIDLGDFITHTFGLNDILKAFKYERERIEGAIKIVILQ